MALGAALGLAVSRYMFSDCGSNDSRADRGCTAVAQKTKHPKVHVLLVNLEFSTPDDLHTWCKEFQLLADKVYANEPHCLSYEVQAVAATFSPCGDDVMMLV